MSAYAETVLHVLSKLTNLLNDAIVEELFPVSIHCTWEVEAPAVDPAENELFSSNLEETFVNIDVKCKTFPLLWFSLVCSYGHDCCTN